MVGCDDAHGQAVNSKMGPRLTLVLAATMLLAVACASRRSAPASPTAPAPSARRGDPPARDRVVYDTVRDAALERRIARLEMALLEKEGQIDELEAQLDEARGEVVRALARLQTVANRAEAASGMAEAEIALQSLRGGASSSRGPETARIAALVQQSSAAFDKQNYGGALYLAGQAKALAAAARARLSPSDRTVTRPGETLFALALRLKTTARGNVRSGPGTTFPVLFALDSGALLTGYSFADDWIRVTDDGGRTGWISRSLVGLRP